MNKSVIILIVVLILCIVCMILGKSVIKINEGFTSSESTNNSLENFGDEDMTGKTAFEHAIFKMSRGLIDINDIESDFEPLYVVDSAKQSRVNDLKKELNNLNDETNNFFELIDFSRNEAKKTTYARWLVI